MYFTIQDLIDKYHEIMKDRKRRLEVEENRFNNELDELRRKTKISQLPDDREPFPWEEE